MKFLNNLGLLSVLLLAGFACTTSTKTTSDDTDETCIYRLDEQSLSFKWTAYKQTKKVAVNGTFDDISLNSAAEAQSLDELLTSVKFSINTSSVNSNEPVRDVKIDQFFFGTMANTGAISGNIKSIDGVNATIGLTINDITLDIPGTITFNGDTVKLSSTVDFKAFSAEEAVAMLNQVCSEKHTGEDGKSIFWDIVDINAQIVHSKACP